MTPSWYDVLDVAPTATAGEIRVAWRAAIADLEPGSRRFQALNQAAEVLLDEQRRAAYDAELAAQEPEPPAVGPTEPDLAMTATTATTALPATTTGAARTAPSVPTWLVAALGVLAAVALGVALWVWQLGDDTSAEDATSAAQSAAEQAIVPVLSYDYENLEADQERAAAYLTSDYREDYDELFGVITDNAPSTQTKVTATVIASGIVRSGEDRVDVLVFVDRPTTNKLTPEPVTYKDQVTVTMQKIDGEWLIDNLVTSPAAQ